MKKRERINTVANLVLILAVASFALLLLAGCSGFPTNWKAKYENVLVVQKNLEGQLEFERTRQGELGQQLNSREQTIQDLQRQIAERSQSPGEAAGFRKAENTRPGVRFRRGL